MSLISTIKHLSKTLQDKQEQAMRKSIERYNNGDTDDSGAARAIAKSYSRLKYVEIDGKKFVDCHGVPVRIDQAKRAKKQVEDAKKTQSQYEQKMEML